MELKKDSNAVSIDMLLIVHSEKRRAAQGTHSDRQADPGAPPQRRGGKVRPARPQAAPAPRPLHLRAHSPQGAPTRPRTRSATQTLSPRLGAPPRCGSGVPWQRAARDCPGPRVDSLCRPVGALSLLDASFLQPLVKGCRAGLEDALEEEHQSLRPDPCVAEVCSPHGTCRVQGTRGESVC